MNIQKEHATAPQPSFENDRITHEPGKSYDIIAKLELIRAAPSGERATISFALGAPYITTDGFWRTPVRITGFGDPSPEVYGIDSLQSLHLAMDVIRKDIASLLAGGDKLMDRDGREFKPAEYFREQ
ncbi:MAG TPA: hypothetical protein VG733_20215 [Chthoniobacteraceae bacterium]|nr:hypothetical protein [Chthoniobacteraceae bacterium]